MWFVFNGFYPALCIQRIPVWYFRIKMRMLRPAMKLMLKNLFMHHIADFLCLYGIVTIFIGYTFGGKGLFFFFVCSFCWFKPRVINSDAYMGQLGRINEWRRPAIQKIDMDWRWQGLAVNWNGQVPPVDYVMICFQSLVLYRNMELMLPIVCFFNIRQKSQFSWYS